MGQLVKMGPSDMIVREPSPEMVRINDAIATLQAEVESDREKLEAKEQTFAHSSAGRLLEPEDKSAQVVAGKASRAVESLATKISESERLLVGLQTHLNEATQCEQERLFLQLEKQVRQNGRHLLELVSKLRMNITERNQLLGKADEIMSAVFWNNPIADANKYFGQFIMLPAPLDPVKDPFDRPCAFLDRLKMLVEVQDDEDQ